jgi:hypothetical protein
MRTSARGRQARATGAFLRALVLALCAVSAFSSHVWALIEIGGRDPLPDPGWPTGALQLANLPTRVSYWVGPPFGGGQYCLQYRSDDAAPFNEALQVFSRIVAPRLELIVLDGANEGGIGGDVDWEFTVWVPANYYRFSEWGRTAPLREPYCALPAPTLTLYPGGPGHLRWEEVAVPSNVHVIDKRVDASPYKDSTGGVVETHVYDMRTGRAMSGVTVSLSRRSREGAANTYRAETDDRGTAVIRDIVKGGYQVELSHAGYASRGLGYYRNLGRTLEVYSATLATARSLHGTVRDPDGRPVAGATVALSDLVAEDRTRYDTAGERVTTDAAGRFSVDGLPAAGEVSARAYKDGYALVVADREVSPDELQIILPFGAVLRGRIKYAVTTSVGQEVHAQLTPEGGNRRGTYGGSMTCGPDGAFEFKNVPAGRYVLTAALSPGSAADTERAPRTTIEVKPTKPGEVIEQNLSVATLHGAAFAGDTAEVEKLLAEGGDVNARDDAQRTPLHYAAGQGRLGVVQLLLAKGADVAARDDAGRTPLHLAAEGGHAVVIEALRAAGADVNATDLNGRTPTGLAVQAGREDVADLLRRHGGVE